MLPFVKATKLGNSTSKLLDTTCKQNLLQTVIKFKGLREDNGLVEAQHDSVVVLVKRRVVRSPC